MDDFIKLIEDRLYKLYPFTEVIVEDDYLNMISIRLSWFYCGTGYNYIERFNKKLCIKDDGYRYFMVRKFINNAIEKIQEVIIKED